MPALLPLSPMRAQDLHLQLDPDSEEPLYQQVARSLEDAIRQGRIHPGVALPGVRELAKRFGVHRNTVLAALSELQAQGLVASRERAGVFVRDLLPTPDLEGPDGGPPTAPGFDLPSLLQPATFPRPQDLDFLEPRADVRLAPTEAMARAYPRAMRLKGAELLGSEDFKGQRRLRETLAAHLAEHRGLAVDPGRLLITRGTGMALALVAQALLGAGAGDAAVEDPGDPQVLGTLRQVPGLRLHPLPVDGQGLRVQDLESLLDRVPLKLVVVSPQGQLPTGAPLSPSRRIRLLELAKARRFAVLELDPEYDHHYGPASPPRPLAAADPAGHVVYLGSLTRVLAPGIHLAYLAGPGRLVDRLAELRRGLDSQADRVLEWAVSELFVDGDFARHLRRLRTTSLERREALCGELAARLGGALAFTPPAVGMGLWVEGRGPLEEPGNFTTWIAACRAQGVRLRPGSSFRLTAAPLAGTRIPFTAFETAELRDAVARMARALPGG